MAHESRLEEDKRQLRMSLEEVENQLSTVELLRRALDAENHRLKAAVDDKETETQACSAAVLRTSCSRYVNNINIIIIIITGGTGTVDWITDGQHHRRC